MWTSNTCFGKTCDWWNKLTAEGNLNPYRIEIISAITWGSCHSRAGGNPTAKTLHCHELDSRLRGKDNLKGGFNNWKLLSHENNRSQSLHRWNTARCLGGEILHLCETHHQHGHCGLWRMLWCHVRPQSHDGDDWRYVQPLHYRHGPFPSRIHVAQSLWLWLHASPWCDTHGCAEWFGNCSVGYHR